MQVDIDRIHPWASSDPVLCAPEGITQPVLGRRGRLSECFIAALIADLFGGWINATRGARALHPPPHN